MKAITYYRPRSPPTEASSISSRVVVVNGRQLLPLWHRKEGADGCR